MFSSGTGPDGKARVETTVCPSRTLAEDSEADDVLDWFLWSVEWNAWSGTPMSIREWPRPGGILRQSAKLVAAAKLLLSEWSHVPRDKPKGKR